MLSRFFRQFALPEGLLGRVAGLVMAQENRRANMLIVDRLDLRAEDRVLEIGCGPGVGVAAVAAKACKGFVAGIDPSPVMVSQSRRRSRAAVAAGRVEVVCTDVAALPYPDASFTRIFAVNSVQHWPCIPAGLDEIARVLQPGGRVIIALRRGRAVPGRDPHSHGASEAQIAELRALLSQIGYVDVDVDELSLVRETLALLTASG